MMKSIILKIIQNKKLCVQLNILRNSCIIELFFIKIEYHIHHDHNTAKKKW